ncbi:MAG: rRNA maturation RNase YbeY [Proteobacteria bacterium]|nr:rRNA maturation RNase YbeY [Pseudomonadota bacterium]
MSEPAAATADPPSPEPRRVGAAGGGRGAEVAVVIDDPRWRKALRRAGPIARRAAGAALRAERGRGAGGEVSVVLAGDALVRRLNRDYRRRDAATNVLSFPAGDPSGTLLGDVVVALDTAAREAEEEGKTLSAHLSHLVVHGVLHLLGYDHDAEARAEEMEARERAVLAGLGVADPYPPVPGRRRARGR